MRHAAEKYAPVDITLRKPIIKAAAIRYCMEHAPPEADGEGVEGEGNPGEGDEEGEAAAEEVWFW